MYWLKTFLFRLKRGISWFVFSFKQNPWQEDYQLFQTIEKVLLDTANYFEKRQSKGLVVGVNNRENVADMRLAAKLIRMRMEEHYWHIEAQNQYDFEKLKIAEKRDERAFKIAMNILFERGFWWWI